jgi:hypothetical protein
LPAPVVGASQSSAPLCHCAENLNLFGLSPSHVPAKVPYAFLPQSPSQARPERTECGTRPCGCGNEATESSLGRSANRPIDRLGIQPFIQQRCGAKDSRPSLSARTGLRRALLADVAGSPERQPREYGSVPLRVGHVEDPTGSWSFWINIGGGSLASASRPVRSMGSHSVSS